MPAGQQEALRRLALPLKIKRLGLSFKRPAAAEAPEPPNRQWRSRPPKAAVSVAMRAIDATYARGARPRFSEIWEVLKARLGPGVTRQQAREAIANDAPRLRGQRGYRSKT